MHVGLDTVRLEGAPFTAHVTQGDRVEAGQRVLTADLAAIEAAGLDITTPVVVLNGDAYDVAPLATGRIAAGDALLATDAKETANGIA